ncbi:diguanylate cyclase domain-containing protein [Emcibacter sp.]|uniref:diguanylate cyclase domain-containing protein n=1 Tax=Emcibacter sp. TaxID=1979954 RepID=UPI003A8FCD2F
MTQEKTSSIIYPILGSLTLTLLVAGMVFIAPKYAPITGVGAIVLLGVFLFHLYSKNNSLEERLEEATLDLQASRDALAAEKSAMQKIAAENIGLAEDNFLAREEAEANNRVVSAIMENMPQAVCAVAADGTLLKWNKKFEPLFSMPEGTARVGIAFSEVTADLDKARLRLLESGDEAESAVPENCAEYDLPQNVIHYERDMQDGRTLEVLRTPMPDGGFIATYTDISERKKSERVIRHMAHYDSLTGLANRVRFTEKLEALLHQNRQTGGRFAVVMIDLDKFKHVNDTYGHPMGDSLLVEVAGIFASNIRSHDIAARLGGDEFALLLGGIKHVDEIMIPLNRIMEKIGQPLTVDDQVLNVGSSMGVALYPLHARSSEDLVKVADEALYAAKKAGRGRIMLASAPGASVPADMRAAGKGN